jgi:acetate CoA/acetoacetate CoA-transferase alpha subunit
LTQINIAFERQAHNCAQSFQEDRQPMKVVSVEDAVAIIPDGASIMVGGFMGIGAPERMLDELARQKKSDLTIIANDGCLPGKGIGKLVDAGLISR